MIAFKVLSSNQDEKGISEQVGNPLANFKDCVCLLTNYTKVFEEALFKPNSLV